MFRRIIALTKNHLYEIFNWPHSLVGRFLNPLLYLLFLGFGIGGMFGNVDYLGLSIPYVMFLFPGLIGIESTSSFSRSIFSSSSHVKWGIFNLFILSGCSTFEYLISMLIINILIIIIQTGLISLLVIFIGGVNILLKIPGLMLLSCLGIFIWVPIGIIIGIKIDNYMKRDLVANLATLPLMLSSSAFYNILEAPVVIKVLGYLNPLTYHVNLIRDYSLSKGSIISFNLLMIFVLSFILFVLAFIFLKNVKLVSGER